MRPARVILFALAALFLGAAAVQHVQSRRARAALEREMQRLRVETQQAKRQAAETARHLETARNRSAAAAAQPKASPPASRPGPGAAPASAAPAKPNPELRRLRVQTFAAEQRMQFAALLHRLDFTSAQRQTFDRIQEEFYGAMLDEKLDAAGRQEAREARGAALRALFGANHDAWLEANRQASARAVVDQIVHQTFPSSGALNAAQADELTRIVAEHRLSATGAPGTAVTYDWDQIIADARTILADRQMEGFIAAVTYRRASEEMSAMARAPR